MRWKISTRNWTKGRDPITRSKLAYQLSKKLKEYLDSMAVSSCGEIVCLALLKSEPQISHSIDGSTPKQWEIGEGFMHLDNMSMVSFESVSKGSFQPVIYVVDPMM